MDTDDGFAQLRRDQPIMFGVWALVVRIGALLRLPHCAELKRLIG